MSAEPYEPSFFRTGTAELWLGPPAVTWSRLLRVTAESNPSWFRETIDGFAKLQGLGVWFRETIKTHKNELVELRVIPP
jgi:hypothetical protein